MAQLVNRGQLMAQEAHQRSQLVADERSQKKQPERTAALKTPPAATKPLPTGLPGCLSASLSSGGSLPAAAAAGNYRHGHTTPAGISPEGNYICFGRGITQSNALFLCSPQAVQQ